MKKAGKVEIRIDGRVYSFKSVPELELKKIVDSLSRYSDISFDLGRLKRAISSHEAKVKRVSAKLKEYREKKGLSQSQLSKLADIDRPNIVAMESGKRTVGPSVAEKLAKALGIDPDDLS